MEHDSADGDDLIERARAGDREARVALFDRYRERLRRMVEMRLDARLQARLDASDVIQDAFVDVVERLDDDLRAPELPLFLWLRLVVGDRLLKLHRHHLGTQMRDTTREVSLYRGALPAASSAGAGGLWDVATRQKAGSLGGPGAEVLGLAFSPDGRDLVACDAGGTLWLWDLAGKRVIACSKAHTSVTAPSLAGCVAFSPDGRRLATSGGDSVVKLWDVGRFQEVAALTGQDGPIYGLAFAPDGNTLASAGDTTVRLWHAPPLDEGPRVPDGPPVLPPLETFRFFTLQVLGTARATQTHEAGFDRIDVTAVDGTDWHVQLQQSFDDLEEGAAYTVRFRARADAPTSLLLGAHISEPNWRNIGLSEKVPLSDGWRTYQYEFRAKAIAAGNWIVFNVGGRTGTVWIADLALTRVAR